MIWLLDTDTLAYLINRARAIKQLDKRREPVVVGSG